MHRYNNHPEVEIPIGNRIWVEDRVHFHFILTPDKGRKLLQKAHLTFVEDGKGLLQDSLPKPYIG